MTLDEAAAQLNCPRAADVMADPAAFQDKHPYFEHGIGGVYSASLDAGPEDNQACFSPNLDVETLRRLISGLLRCKM